MLAHKQKLHKLVSRCSLGAASATGSMPCEVIRKYLRNSCGDFIEDDVQFDVDFAEDDGRPSLASSEVPTCAWVFVRLSRGRAANEAVVGIGGPKTLNSPDPKAVPKHDQLIVENSRMAPTRATSKTFLCLPLGANPI